MKTLATNSTSWRWEESSSTTYAYVNMDDSGNLILVMSTSGTNEDFTPTPTKEKVFQVGHVTKPNLMLIRSTLSQYNSGRGRFSYPFRPVWWTLDNKPGKLSDILKGVATSMKNRAPGAPSLREMQEAIVRGLAKLTEEQVAVLFNLVANPRTIRTATQLEREWGPTLDRTVR